jgi:hypothetical protein
MKSRLTHPLSQLVLASIALIAISIACSSSKSAESPSPQVANAASNQPLTSPDVSPTQSQSNCTLNMSQAPVINGLKLGMTTEEVLALFPGSKDDAEVRAGLSKAPSRFGTSGLMIRPDKFANKAEFSGVSQITFTLLDGRVATFHIGYNGPRWSHVDQFVTKFVDGTSLPAADQWQPYTGLDHQMKTLTCAGFTVTIFAGGEGGSLNYVQMQDVEADKKLKERRKKAREQASPTPANQ